MPILAARHRGPSNLGNVLMRDDLEDAYAAVDWANSQLPSIEQAIKSWFESPPYFLVEEPHPEMGQKLFKLQINRRLPAASINASAGAVINSIRSALDLLAASLARRNGKTPNADRHFPIYASVVDFIDPLAAKERKQWLSEGERQIIEGLKPYAGGNDLLYAIHRLDVTRKHDRLIRVTLTPSGVMVPSEAWQQGLRLPTIWPGFEDGAVVAWTNLNATNCDFHIPTEITFNETDLIGKKPLVAALREFSGMTNAIIQMFE